MAIFTFFNKFKIALNFQVHHWFHSFIHVWQLEEPLCTNKLIDQMNYTLLSNYTLNDMQLALKRYYWHLKLPHLLSIKTSTIINNNYVSALSGDFTIDFNQKQLRLTAIAPALTAVSHFTWHQIVRKNTRLCKALFCRKFQLRGIRCGEIDVANPCYALAGRIINALCGTRLFCVFLSWYQRFSTARPLSLWWNQTIPDQSGAV